MFCTPGGIGLALGVGVGVGVDVGVGVGLDGVVVSPAVDVGVLFPMLDAGFPLHE